MAHGAPDHVQMTDINLLDYVDKSYHMVEYIIAPTETWTPINISNVGAFGYGYFYTNDSTLKFTITVDGLAMLDQVLGSIFISLGSSGYGLAQRLGVSRWDAVVSQYAIWCNYDYYLSFKKSLSVSFYNQSLGNKAVQQVHFFWKEKV